MILLDTNTVSELAKQNPVTWNKLLSHKRSEIFLCQIVVSELLFGLALLEDSKRKILLKNEIDPLLESITILTWDTEVSQCFSQIKSDLSRQGQIIADLDIAIAAHCLRYSTVLATDNQSDFKRIEGLDLVNWKV